MNQLTLKAPIKVEGKGLHSGRQLTAVFNPAPANFGVKFKRVDLEGQPVVDALAENVVDTTRGTALEPPLLRRPDFRLLSLHRIPRHFSLSMPHPYQC